MIGRAARAWVELMDRREPPASLWLARVLVSTMILIDLLTARYHGVVELVWPGGGGWWLAACILAVLFGLGAATRLSGLVLLYVLARLAILGPEGDRGIDVLFRAAVGILALSRSHARGSVDAWIRARIGRPVPADVLIPAWPRYLLFLQLVWLYLSAATFKTHAPWTPFGGFSALSIILSDPHFARFEPFWVAPIYPLTQLATAATMFFEWSSPLFLFASLERPGRLGRALRYLRFRRVWLLLGVTFHLALAVTLRLGIFPFGMLALYPVFFDPDDLLLFARAGRRRGRGDRRPGSNPVAGRAS